MIILKPNRILFLFALTFASHAGVSAEEPNLIVIMADDLGYADVGFNGCQDIPTPHIDSLAAKGVKFSSGYVAYSVCGPSRAGFMTGRYGQRFGFERNPQYRTDDDTMGLPISEMTLATVLKRVGYHSGIIGKWHLGATEKLHPLNRGFDEFYGHLGGGHAYFPESLTIQDSYQAQNESESYRTWIMKNHEPVPPRKYLTDDFSDEAVRFIERNYHQPFFLFLSYNAPHTPLQASPEYLARFHEIKDQKRRTYAAMVSAVDDGVGRVVQSLKDHHIEENTLVFFLSDNGGIPTKNAANNAPLRGHKGTVWEGGFRVPFAAKWPAGFPQGLVYEHPVSSLDIFATITALAEAPVDSERPLDGVNLTPYVNGLRKEPPHQGIYLRKYDQGIRAVRSGDHKLIVFDRTGVESLHNLKDDIGENHNIASDHSELRNQLTALWADWNQMNVEPAFAGLMMAKSDRQKQKLAANKKNSNQSRDNEKSPKYWKDRFFQRHPEADANQDGVLSWPEYKAAKGKLNQKKDGIQKQ